MGNLGSHPLVPGLSSVSLHANTLILFCRKRRNIPALSVPGRLSGNEAPERWVETSMKEYLLTPGTAVLIGSHFTDA